MLETKPGYCGPSPCSWFWMPRKYMECLCNIRELEVVVANCCFCSNQFVECYKINTRRIENDCNIHLQVMIPSQVVKVKHIVVLWRNFPRYTKKLFKTKSQFLNWNKSVWMTNIIATWVTALKRFQHQPIFAIYCVRTNISLEYDYFGRIIDMLLVIRHYVRYTEILWV